MGWFFWSKTQDESSNPTRENRQKCWETRNAYLACLDTAGIVKPGMETKPTCAKEKKSYDENCAKSWIEYFNKRRVIADAQKESLAQSAANLGEKSGVSKK